jgi:hypothetical protein
MDTRPAPLTAEDAKLVAENVASGSKARRPRTRLATLPADRLSVLRLAWRHLECERESSVGVAIALLLALLPAVLLFVDSAGARTDLRALVAGSGGVVVQRAGVTDGAAFDAFQRQARDQVAPPLGQYVEDGGASATTGPFRIDSINSQPPSGPVGSSPVEVVYVSNLASRVDVGQGVLSKLGVTGGAEGSASMPQAVADRAGIRLFDEVCLRPASSDPNGAPLRCVRVVGLWRPVGGASPARPAANLRPGGGGGPSGPVGGMQLFTERDEFFGMVGLNPPRTADAARVYEPRPAAIAAQDATAIAERVRAVRASVLGSRTGEVRTTLDTDLERYTAARAAVGFPVRLLAAALIPLLVLLAGVLARWYMAPRLHDLALLRARGWSRGRVQRLVLAQFGILGSAALGVVLVALLILAWRADGAIGPGAPPPSRGELVGVAVAVGIPLLAAAWFVWLARWASRQSVLRLDHPEAETSRSLSWRGAELNALLVLPAALLLLLPRLAGSQRLPSGALDDLVALGTAVAGLVTIVVALLPALSLAGEAYSRRRTDVAGTLAQWQLRRWWQRHAPAGFLVVLAFAIASFTAVTFTNQVLHGPGPLGSGVAVSLAIGFLTAVGAGLLAYGLVFLFASRSRADDYTALMVDGLSETAARKSLAIEQHTVLAEGLVLGLALGLVLVWASSTVPGAVGAALAPEAVVGGLVATAVIGLASGAWVADRVRRSAVDFALVEQGRRTT